MKAESDFGLKETTLDAIVAVLQEFSGVEKAIIYGSRAMENYKYNSDIDLTLIGSGLGLTELFRIENELDDLLLPYQIDLSLFHQIDNPDLINHIQEHGKLLFERSAVISK